MNLSTCNTMLRVGALLLLLCRFGNAACISNLKQISDAENQVKDFTVVRTYELCNDTTFNVGSYQDYYDQAFNGNKIVLRPNLHIQCGSNGRRSNKCIVKGGDLQLDGSTMSFPKSDLNNIMITGVTFEDSKQHLALLQKPGEVLFRDCEFRDHTKFSKVPIKLDYFDLSSSRKLTVRFRRCDFLSNSLPAGSTPQPSLIVATSSQNKLEVTDCKFEDNDMKTNNGMASRNSFLIESSGEVELTRNCFRDNLAEVALVSVYGRNLKTSDNFHQNSPGKRCAFVAWFKTASSYQTFSPDCVGFDASTCNIGAPPLPTKSPTSAPTKSPTRSPSVSPTQGPTNRPSDLPSSVPSGSPTPNPTSAPSVSTQPSEVPSRTPTKAPLQVAALQSSTVVCSLVLSYFLMTMQL